MISKVRAGKLRHDMTLGSVRAVQKVRAKTRKHTHFGEPCEAVRESLCSFVPAHNPKGAALAEPEYVALSLFPRTNGTYCSV